MTAHPTKDAILHEETAFSEAMNNGITENPEHSSYDEIKHGKEYETLLGKGTYQSEELEFAETWFSQGVEKLENWTHEVLSKYRRRVKILIYVFLVMIYLAYFGYCMYHSYGDEGSIVLLVITLFLVCKVFFKILDSRGIEVRLPSSFRSCLISNRGKRFRKLLKILAVISVTAGILSYLVLDVFPYNKTNLQSFFGMLAMILLCFIFSSKPSRVNWHPIFWSFAIQVGLATFTLRTRIGRDIFKWLGDLVKTLFDFSDVGSILIIGKEFRTFGLALSASGVVIFVNAFISLLSHWGVIDCIVLNMGGFLSFCLETGPVESVTAAANIFMSPVEAPLMIRPYLPTVSKSELHAIMACGFASISGSGLGVFVRMGAPVNHLLTAAVISAPAALAIAKLMYPETEKVTVKVQTDIKIVDEKTTNSLSAFADGAMMAVSVCASCWSIMLAFVSVIRLMDTMTGWCGDRAGIHGISFGVICSYVLFPLAYLMGADVSDCRKLGELIGIKLFSTPFLSYKLLGNLIENRRMFEDYTSSTNSSWHWDDGNILLEASNTTLVGGIVSERTEVIATYAMCGFSALSALGITLGVMVPLCPQRKQDVINLVVRAFVAGNMASFATGAVAGALFS